MSNLKRYTESFCCGEYDGMEEDSLAGEWVKFDDIKELLNTSHNSRLPQCASPSEHSWQPVTVRGKTFYRCRHCSAQQ